MISFLIYAIIIACLMFIWTYVFLNKSSDKINQSFLLFLGLIMLWMTLSECSQFMDFSLFGTVLRTIYWYSILNLAIFFLHFVYRLIRRKLDCMFYGILLINTGTIAVRYLFPIDYSDPTFWRLTNPVVAPIMACLFSLPAAYALFLIIRKYIMTGDGRLKIQLRNLFIGMGFSTVISVFSEYILPTWFHFDAKFFLMDFAILILVIYIFNSVLKHKFLNIRSEYIYSKLLTNSNEGILIINKKLRIVSVNELARNLLQNETIEMGDRITDYLNVYDFTEEYKQHEIEIKSETVSRHLVISQHAIDPSDPSSDRLLAIADITPAVQLLRKEKDYLIRESSLDKLTGLYNKEYFNKYYQNLISVEDEGASLLFIDIDNFKLINDQYGHLAGDKILQNVAACVDRYMGKQGSAFRFGGDEFVVILKKTGINKAHEIAETIRVKANQLLFLEVSADIRISLSIGLMEGKYSLEEMIKKADQAMYHSKSEGKNRTTIYDEHM